MYEMYILHDHFTAFLHGQSKMFFFFWKKVFQEDN